MVKYRSSKCPQHRTASLLIGSELLTGLSDKLIKDVIERCMEIKDVSMLMHMDVGSHDIAHDILDLLKTVNIQS